MQVARQGTKALAKRYNERCGAWLGVQLGRLVLPTKQRRRDQDGKAAPRGATLAACEVLHPGRSARALLIGRHPRRSRPTQLVSDPSQGRGRAASSARITGV